MTSDRKDNKDGAFEACPNPECQWHNKKAIPRGIRWYRRHGFYESAQHGKIARYVCRNCNRTFSDRTFEKDFYLHFDGISVSEIGLAWLRGETERDIAKEIGITPQMVRTRLKRFDAYAKMMLEGWEVAEPEDPDNNAS